MTDNITKREKLYNNLISTGKVSEQELGTKDDFLAAVQDKESASYLYGNLKTKFDEEEIGDSSKFWDYLSSDFDTVQPAKVVQPNNIVQANKSTQPIKSGLAPMTVVPEPITTLQSPFQKEVKAPVSLMSPEQQKAQQELSMPKSVADVDNELKSLKDKDGEFLSLYRQIKTKAKGGYDRGMMSSMGSGGKTLNLFSLFNSPKLTKEEQAFYEQNKEVGDRMIDSEYALLLQRDLLKLRDNLQKYDSQDSGLKTFWKGLTQTGLLEDFLTMGQGEIRRNLDLLGIFAKAERKPESLTKEENDLLDVYNDFKRAESSNTDAWFTAGQSSQAMPAFIASMVGTNLAAGGLRAGMRQAFGVATKQMLKGATKRAIVTNVGKKIGESALFNVMALPSRPMFYQELSGNRIDGYKKDENGKVENNGKSLGADVYEASVRTFMEYFAEEFSMATGGAATKLLDSKGTRKLLGSTFSKLRKVTDNKAFKSATKLLDYANIGSIPEEMFEEVLTQAGNALFLWSKDDIAQLANPEFYKSVAISVVAMQGAMTGTQLAAGGVGNIIEKGRVNKQASQSIKKLDEIALTVSDESLSNQISLLSDALRSGDIIDDNKDVDNSKAIITYNKILDTIGDNEELADVSATAAKAVIDNAKKYGVYEGIAAMAEKAIGGQFTHAKSPDTVVLTKKGDSTYYVLDQMEDENSSGGGIMIVRDVETGEKKTLNSLEVDDISYITKEEFLNSWMLAKDVINEQEQIEQQATEEMPPVNEVQQGGTYMLAGHAVTVVDITEDGIGVQDESGQMHMVEENELSEMPEEAKIREEVLEEQIGNEQAQVQEEQAAGTPAQIEQPEQIATENTLPDQQGAPIEFPRDKKGNIDYSGIVEPQAYAQALNEEFGEESIEIIDELISQQQKNLKKAKTTENVIERKRKERIINAEIEKLNQIREIISPKVEVMPEITNTQESVPIVEQPQNEQPLGSKNVKNNSKRIKTTPFREEVRAIGDPVSAEEIVALAIINNVKIKLNDTKGAKGFAKHLGITNSRSEQNKYIGIRNEKEGLTPERFAEYLKETDETHLLQGIDDIELTSIVIDVMRLAYSKRKALEFIQKGRESLSEGAMEMAYYAEIAEAELDEMIEDYYAEIYSNVSEEEYNERTAIFNEALQNQELFIELLNSEDLPDYETGTTNTRDAGFVAKGADSNIQNSSAVSDQEQDSNEGGDNQVSGRRQNEDGDMGKGDEVVRTNTGRTPQAIEIEKLKKERESTISERDRLLKLGADRIGLFGDTKADPNDLFQGQGYDPSALQPQIDRQKEIIAEIDRKIEVLKKNEAAGIEEAKGQQSIENKLTQEEAKVNLNPTEAQKEAGNYKKGHVTIQGLDITIEQPKGSVRSGVDPDGKEWSITMNNTYGYALGTKSKDGDHIDIFLGDNLESDQVFVVDQINKDKSFDEHKVMIGFDSLEDAQAAYLSNYEAGWQGLGDISETTMVQFKDWAKMEGRRIKPFTEYKENKTVKEDTKTSSAQPDKKIEDFGEKIEGARKDQIKKYFDKINLNGQILSTIFPKPDIKGLIESGLSIKDISGIKVAHEFATKDKKRGADVIRFYAAYAKNILAESINLEFNSGGYVFTEYGKSQVELRTKAYQQVAKELGDEYLQLDLTKVRISEMSEREVRNLVNKDISGRFKVQYYVSASKYFTTEEEAISAFTELVKGNTTKDTVQYKHKIKVYQSRSTRDYYLGFQPKGKEFIKLSDNYKTAKEAFEYQKNNEADLQIELERIISEQKIGDKKPSVRLKFSNETTRDRVGKDWRGGRNIDSKEFAETFGFRGVEFGNWVNQKERQVFVNNSFDSLMDLAQLLNIPPKAISLSGQLGITFGSRGSGKAAAHYEPGRKIINLTKTQGLGSLAHEWYHAIDNYFAGFGINITGMKSATNSEFKPEVRDEVKKAFENLYRSLNTGTYKARSRNLDNSRSKNYYSLTHELSARAFENYILSRLNESGQVNDFIVNYISVEDWNGEASKYPYPKSEESKVIYEAFNNLFETLDTKTDENNVTLLYEPLNTYKEYEKEETEKAFGTEERKREAVEKVSNLLREPEYVYHRRGENSLLDKVRPRTIVDTFQESGYVDVLGQKIETPQDLADIFAIHRSPYIEKHHIIFVKDGIIVGSTATTLNRIDAARTAGMDDIDRLYRSFGADGMYYLHNHPSGNHTPSSQDVYVTFGHKEEFEQNGINLIGHVVIDTDKLSYIDTSKPLLTSYTNRAEIERYLLNDVNEFEYKTAVPKLFTQRESLLANNNPQQRMFEIGKALIGERGYSTVVVYSSPNLSITAYDVVPDGSSVEDIKTAIRDGINSNLGSRAFIVHDGSIEYKWGTLQGELEDVINTKKMESDDFSKGADERQLNKDAITLWDKKSEYDSNHYRSNDILETITIDGVEKPTTNSNGQLIAQTEDGVRNFYKWFGDSMVVDEQGRPLVVYHGTNAEFDRFEKMGMNDLGLWGKGYYFTTKIEHANSYAERQGYGANVIPVYLSIQNPLKLTTDKDRTIRLPDGANFRNLLKSNLDGSKIKEIAKSNNNDGVIQTIINGTIGDLVVFNSNQIKSAIGNTGAFNPNDIDIMLRGQYFYSPTEQALNSIKQEKGTPDQWKAMLLKNGAKQAEMDWMDWESFAEDKKSITKTDIQDWIDQNRIEVQEVEKGADSERELELLNNELESLRVVTKTGVGTTANDYTITYSDEKRAKELQNKINSFNNPNTKYSQYQEPGGENYKELLLTMPVRKTFDKSKLEIKRHLSSATQGTTEIIYNGTSLGNFGDDPRYVDGELKQKPDSEWIKYAENAIAFGDNYNKIVPGDNFKSSHFDEPNILAHIRFNERTVNGERVLFIEEIQSDWAQKGKKEGFKQSNVELRPLLTTEELDITQSEHQYHTQIDGKTYDVGKGVVGSEESAKRYFVNWLNKEIVKSNDRIQTKNRYATPNMPFKNTDQWVNLALRRMMTYAAENGFYRIAWTNGEMQAARYDLSKQTDFVDYWRNSNGTYGFGLSVEFNKPSELTESELESYLGKEIASKIINDKTNPTEARPNRLEGENLKVGGTGMKAFYDNIIPAQANKIGKKFGAKVSSIDIVFDKSEYEDLGGGNVVNMETGEPGSGVEKLSNKTASVQSIPITQGIREQAQVGMPLYKGKHTASNPLKPKTKFSQATEQDKFRYATELANSFGVKVNVVTDVSQIPASSVKMRRAKGWFNPKTGEVTVVLPNHTSFEDLQATILHEVVAHKGLRGLLGEQFTPTMQRVFYSMSGTKQADYLARYGDKVTAAEEYMSEMAETSQDPTFLEKVIAIIRDAFRALGIELHLSDSDMRFMLWRSKNRLKSNPTAMEVIKDIVSAQDIKNKFRSSELPIESNTITLTKGQRIVEKVQDRMVSGTVLIKEIKSRNGKVGAFSNFVSEETRSSSRAKAEIDDFLENYFKPVTNIIGEWHAQGISIEEAENYMKAKHAPEVNKNITSREVRQSVPLWIEASINRLNEKLGVLKTEKAKRNTQDSINTLKRQLDFINNKANASNLQQLLSNAYDVVFSGSAKSISTTGSTFDLMLAVAIHDRYIKAFKDVQSSDMSNIRSGKSDQQAMQEIVELEAKITPSQVTKFWDAVRKATRFSLDKSFKYGLISKELYDGTTGMYEYYVPLRGWDVKEEVDYSDIFGENYMGHEILNPVNKQAKGRISEAEGPLGYIGSMAETSIVAGNKNEVRRNAWRLIKNNEGMTDLFLIKDTWLVNVAELGEEAIWEQTYEVPSQEMIDMGKAKKASPNTTYEWHKTRGELEKHQVPVMIDGKRVVMEFKGKELGPRVAAAINGDNIVRWRGTEGVAKVTRIMAALKTSKNPDFMLTNFVRDFLFGGMSYYIRGGNPVAMTANLKRAWVAIHKDFTKGKENPYLKQMYEDFKMSGGETGYVHMLGQPDFMKKAERLIKDASMAGKISGASVARKTGHLINHSLDYLANMSENAMRFAAYLTEAERMMNEEGVNIPTESIKKQASLAAKELTTNFNRKGTWGSQVNGLYAFMNASIQGTANYFKLAKENPVKFVKANLALLAVRTFFNALCMLLAGDDDKDDYYSLSDYVKENNFVIPVGNRQYITIPLPHGARALTSIGLYSLEVLAGKRDAGKASVDYVKNIVSEISPVNLVGLDRSAFLLPTTISEGILTITPTILRPIAEAGANIDFMANPIERENFVITDNDYVPRFQNAYSNTNKILVGSAKFLNNEIGGGNDYRSSGIRIGSNGVPYRSKAWGIFDMSPAYTEHIIESYLGGAGRFVNDLYKTARSTVKGEVPDKRNIPVLRRFIQEPYQTKAIKGYYETRTRVSDINRAKKAALESENEFEFVQLNNAYNNELSITFDKYNKQIRKWSKIKNNIVNDDAKLEAASEHINKLMELLNKDIASIDKRYNHIRK